VIHLLVEGPSERALLNGWIPRVLKGKAFRVHPHQGKGTLPIDLDSPPDPKKRGLLDQLVAKLRGYAASPQSELMQIVVLVDADSDAPKILLESIRRAAFSVAPNLSVAVCLAIEETEAFYLGDLKALEQAFPEANLKMARSYVPDSIVGTWELFGRVVGDGGGNKVAWAKAMAPKLTTDAKTSRSQSFQILVSSLRRLEVPAAVERLRRPYRHAPRPKTRTGKR
jgi:hypothetical protein